MKKLIQMARKQAKDVQKSKTTITLDPMTSDERRIIHNALSNYSNIKTTSVGQGRDRKLTISYLEQEKKHLNCFFLLLFTLFFYKHDKIKKRC